MAAESLEGSKKDVFLLLPELRSGGTLDVVSATTVILVCLENGVRTTRRLYVNSIRSDWLFPGPPAAVAAPPPPPW